MVREYRGKENGVNILKSIDEGPFQMGTNRDPIAEGTEGAQQLGLERARVYSDLSPEDKDRYNDDIRATNILLQGLPKDIYTLINHYTEAKDIWDNVKILLEGETIHDYYVRFAKLINDMRNIKMTMSIMQLNSKFVNNMLPEWGRFVTAVKLNRGLRDSNYDLLYAYLKQHEAHANENKMMLDRFTQHTVDPLALMSNVSQQQYYSQSSTTQPSTHLQPHLADNTSGPIPQRKESQQVDQHAAGYGGAQNRVRNANPGQARQIKCYNCNVKDLALNVDNVFQADDCDAFDSNVDEAPTAQTMVMENLSSAYLVYDEADPSYDSDILSEVNDNDHYQDAVCEHHEVHEMHDDVQPNYVVDSHTDYTIMVEEVTSLKKDFKQKENKYLEEFLDMKALKEKVEDKLYKQDQSLQTVHMLCKPKPYYDEQNKVAIGYKNPLCLTRAKQVQPALYNGHEIIKTNHVPAIVHNSKDTLEIAEITRMKMNDKMKDRESVKKKVKIAPHDYSKENYLATFTPQKKLTPEQIFWSKDLIKIKAEALKEQTTASRPIKALTMKHDEIERKNLLIANDNLIANCLSKKVFYIATNSELTVSRFTEMHAAHTVVQARCLKLEAELSKLLDKVQKYDHTELVKHFSNLEVNHLNLQLKYQNLKECFGNSTSPPIRDAHDFDLVFLIKKLKASIHGKDNAIKKLRMQISQLNETRSETDRTLDFRALDFQITQLTNKVTVLQEQNELFRTVNAKIKAEFTIGINDSIKITRAKHIEQTTALLTENENLKAQIHENMKCITMYSVKPRVLATGRNVETLRKIIEEAKVERPLDSSLAFAFLYTKHSQELTVRFENDQFGAIMGSGDYVIGDSVISREAFIHDEVLPNLFVVQSLQEQIMVMALSFEPLELRFTWVKFLRSKDETLEVVIKFLKQIQIGLNKTVRYIRTDNGTEFVNQVLTEYYERVGIFHQKSVPRTPQQNGVVERRNRTLVEAARTMLIFSKAPMFLWAEAVATACYTQNRSLIHTRHNKTPYELVHDKKPDLTFFRVFGALCYPTNDSEDLGKLQPTADIGIFVGYAPSRKGYRIYNKRTRRIMETIHVQFDELSEPMAPVQLSTGPAPTFLTPGQITVLVPFNSVGTPSSTTIDQDAPSPSHSPSSSALQSLSLQQGIAAESTIMEENPFAPVDNDPFVNVFAPEPSSEASSPGDVISSESTYVTQTHHHLGK
ncbi:retrovirus-related pol polyprotein from transposon TNT 1-94 [Tanacetum coccineum]